MYRRMHSVTVAVAAAAASATAFGADWELNPRVEAGYLIDDNYRLAHPGNEVEVQGPLADAQLEVRARTQQGEFSFTPRIRATYFPDEQDLDTVDYFALADWQHRGQRYRARVRGEFSQEDVVNSEQPDAEVPGDSGLGEPDFGDSGRVLVENRRTRLSLRPTFDFELSGRRALEFGANFADISYDRQVIDAQVDYRSNDLTAGLVTRFSPVSSLTARVRGARYEFSDLQSDSNSTSYGLELQWDRRTASEIETFLRGGAQKVTYENDLSVTAWLAGAGVSMPVGRNTLFADLTRSVGPSSAGVVIARDQLRLSWSRDFTPRLALLVGARGTHDEDLAELTVYRPRSYATGNVGLSWRWREEFSLLVSYDYTWQKFDEGILDHETGIETSIASTSNGASISITYQPLQRRR